MDQWINNVVSLDERRRQGQDRQIQKISSGERAISKLAQPFGSDQSHVEDRPYQVYLEEKIKSLENQIKEIKEMLQELSIPDQISDEVIEMKDISYDQAKEGVAKYFRDNDGREIGYEELVEELKIDPKLVVQACNELVKEGKIG